MKKILSALFFSLLIFITQAQTNVPKDAKVEGTIVDMRSKQPQNNELIIFRSQKNTNEYQAISDSLGSSQHVYL